MSQPVALFEGDSLRVEDSRCRQPRSGPGPLRGGEPIHLALVRRGSFQYQLGARLHLGDSCTALLHEAEREYRVAHCGNDGDDTTLIVLDAALAEELFGSPERRPTELPVGARTQLLHARLLVALQQHGDGALGACERVMELLRAIAAQDRDDGARCGPAQRRAVRRARELLVSNPSSNLALKDVAREAGCSPFELMRSFRRETGRSLRGYRRELRVMAALPRLAAGEGDLGALAVELGFSHHSHLTATFQQVIGATPRQVRAGLRARF